MGSRLNGRAFSRCLSAQKRVSMNAWQNSGGGSCVMRIASRALCRRWQCVGCLAIRRRASCHCIVAEKNGVRPVWQLVSQLLRPTTAASAGFVVRRHAGLLGAGRSPSRLSDLRRGEGRASGLAGGPSVLHEAVCLLRRAALPGLVPQSGGAGAAVGLEDGQGVGLYVRV